MEIRARVANRPRHHEVQVSTNGSTRSVPIAARETGFGSSVNGGEFLALALATCYCNDLYREATPRGIAIHSVEVEVIAAFGGLGEPAQAIRYRVAIAAAAPEETVRELAEHTDSVAEIHNTLRVGIPVRLEGVTVNSSPGPSGA